MNNDDAFAGLEPAGLWEHFAAITRIPRPSGREEQMAAYVRSWAERLGWPADSDAAGNLCVHAPGTAGREDSPAVVLQAHLDMVCERDAGSPYDAERGQIHAVRDGDWIRADGTTLGADNGIGVAAMLAVAEDPGITRGPLDLLFTVDEETGLNGAQALDPAIVRGRVLVNLDHEMDGELCVGCAGSGQASVAMRRPRTPAPPEWPALTIRVGGLLGGHSGMDIARPRLNAIRALARLLRAAADAAEVRLIAFAGGNKRNAIPREASATIVVPPGAEDAVRRAVAAETEALRRQFGAFERGLTVDADAAGAGPRDAWSAEDTGRLADLVLTLPSGVIAMSPTVTGLVETSSSVGTAVTEDGEVRIGSLIRSSLRPAVGDVLRVIGAAARLAGAEMTGDVGYPGWQPDPDSRVRRVAAAAYERLFGAAPAVTGVHAGLECGIIGERLPGMDMVAFGPEIRGAHAPGERVHAGSVQRFWRWLAAVLDDLSR